MSVRSWWRARRERRRAIPVATVDSRVLDSVGYGRGENPKFNRTLITISPEATSDWLGGGPLDWEEGIKDPVLRLKMAQERREIKLGLSIAMAHGLDVNDPDDLVRVGILLADSLPNSPTTAKELRELCVSVFKGAPKTAALRRKLVELAEFAYGQEEA